VSHAALSGVKYCISDYFPNCWNFIVKFLSKVESTLVKLLKNTNFSGFPNLFRTNSICGVKKGDVA
jgi:hypothetical protein